MYYIFFFGCEILINILSLITVSCISLFAICSFDNSFRLLSFFWFYISFETSSTYWKCSTCHDFLIHFPPQLRQPLLIFGILLTVPLTRNEVIIWFGFCILLCNQSYLRGRYLASPSNRSTSVFSWSICFFPCQNGILPSLIIFLAIYTKIVL